MSAVSLQTCSIIFLSENTEITLNFTATALRKWILNEKKEIIILITCKVGHNIRTNVTTKNLRRIFYFHFVSF